MNEILNLSTLDEVLKYADRYEYYGERLQELKDLIDEEVDQEIQLESVKGMFIFLSTFKPTSRPTSLTINDEGHSHLEYEVEENFLLLKFEDTYSVKYVMRDPTKDKSSKYAMGSLYLRDISLDTTLSKTIATFL